MGGQIRKKKESYTYSKNRMNTYIGKKSTQYSHHKCNGISVSLFHLVMQELLCERSQPHKSGLFSRHQKREEKKNVGRYNCIRV